MQAWPLFSSSQATSNISSEETFSCQQSSPGKQILYKENKYNSEPTKVSKLKLLQGQYTWAYPWKLSEIPSELTALKHIDL